MGVYVRAKASKTLSALYGSQFYEYFLFQLWKKIIYSLLISVSELQFWGYGLKFSNSFIPALHCHRLEPFKRKTVFSSFLSRKCRFFFLFTLNVALERGPNCFSSLMFGHLKSLVTRVLFRGLNWSLDGIEIIVNT